MADLAGALTDGDPALATPSFDRPGGDAGPVVVSPCETPRMTEPRPDPPPEPPGPFGWPGLGRYLRGPEGLSPLSPRRRDVIVRWAGFAAIVTVLVAFIAIMFLARRV